MVKANIQELKNDFPRFLQKLRKGLTVTLCYRNKAIATIVPLPDPDKTTKVPPLGAYQDLIEEFDPEAFDHASEVAEEFYGSLTTKLAEPD